MTASRKWANDAVITDSRTSPVFFFFRRYLPGGHALPQRHRGRERNQKGRRDNAKKKREEKSTPKQYQKNGSYPDPSGNRGTVSRHTHRKERGGGVGVLVVVVVGESDASASNASTAHTHVRLALGNHHQQTLNSR